MSPKHYAEECTLDQAWLKGNPPLFEHYPLSFWMRSEKPEIRQLSNKYVADSVNLINTVCRREDVHYKTALYCRDIMHFVLVKWYDTAVNSRHMSNDDFLTAISHVFEAFAKSGKLPPLPMEDFELTYEEAELILGGYIEVIQDILSLKSGFGAKHGSPEEMQEVVHCRTQFVQSWGAPVEEFVIQVLGPRETHLWLSGVIHKADSSIPHCGENFDPSGVHNSHRDGEIHALSGAFDEARITVLLSLSFAAVSKSAVFLARRMVGRPSQLCTRSAIWFMIDEALGNVFCLVDNLEMCRSWGPLGPEDVHASIYEGVLARLAELALPGETRNANPIFAKMWYEEGCHFLENLLQNLGCEEKYGKRLQQFKEMIPTARPLDVPRSNHLHTVPYVKMRIHQAFARMCCYVLRLQYLEEIRSSIQKAKDYDSSVCSLRASTKRTCREAMNNIHIDITETMEMAADFGPTETYLQAGSQESNKGRKSLQYRCPNYRKEYKVYTAMDAVALFLYLMRPKRDGCDLEHRDGPETENGMASNLPQVYSPHALVEYYCGMLAGLAKFMSDNIMDYPHMHESNTVRNDVFPMDDSGEIGPLTEKLCRRMPFAGWIVSNMMVELAYTLVRHLATHYKRNNTFGDIFGKGSGYGVPATPIVMRTLDHLLQGLNRYQFPNRMDTKSTKFFSGKPTSKHWRRLRFNVEKVQMLFAHLMGGVKLLAWLVHMVNDPDNLEFVEGSMLEMRYKRALAVFDQYFTEGKRSHSSVTFDEVFVSGSLTILLRLWIVENQDEEEGVDVLSDLHGLILAIINGLSVRAVTRPQIHQFIPTIIECLEEMWEARDRVLPPRPAEPLTVPHFEDGRPVDVSDMLELRWQMCVSAISDSVLRLKQVRLENVETMPVCEWHQLGGEVREIIHFCESEPDFMMDILHGV
eukprot:Clim_evm28s235 gene=Clim_evmTU28s235